MDLKDRLNIASQSRTQGYNCAQAVILAFPDITNLPEKTAIHIGAPLGAGVASLGEICGVATGMSIVEGFRHPANPQSKAPAMQGARTLCSRFAEENGGCLRCRDLKRPDAPRTCNQLISQGITILHNAIAKE